jgi:hypothetical protein
MPDAKESSFGKLLPLIAVVAVAGVAWKLLTPLAVVSDPTPLPHGVVSPPDLASLNSKSEVRVELRLAIDALAALIRKSPFSVDDGDGTGKITITTLQMSPKDGSRIRMDKALASFEGSYPVKGLTITGADLNLSKTTLEPRIDDEWVFRGNPEVDLRVDDIDEPSLIPDPLIELAANTIFKGSMRRLIDEKTNIPLERLIETQWQQLNVDLRRSVGDAEGVLSLRPSTPVVMQPVVDGALKTMRMGLGVDFTSVLALGDVPVAPAEAAASRPPLKELPPGMPAKSRLRLPIVVRVIDLSRMWKPCKVPGVDDDFWIEAIDMSEKDGLLHGRMHLTLQRKSGSSPLLPRSIKASIRFQARPTCDAKHGRLGITDFTFTEKSNSILIDLIGSKVNALISTAITRAVGELSDACFRKAEVAARTHVNDMLADEIARWAESVRTYSDELKRVKPEVTDIVFNPTDVTIKDGHLIVTLQADSTIVLSLDDAGAKPTPATDGSNAPAS